MSLAPKILSRLGLNVTRDPDELAKRAHAATLAELLLLATAYAFVVNSSLRFLEEPWTNLGSDFIWTHFWIPQTMNVDWYLKCLAPIQMLLFPMICLGYRHRSARFLILALTFFNFATQFTYIEGYSGHFLFWPLLTLTLAPNTPFGKWSGLRFAQIQVLTIYFISGFWKARGHILADSNTVSFFEYAQYAIAQEYLSSNHVSCWRDFLLDHPFFGFLGALFTHVIEAMAPVFIFFPKYFRWIGLLFISFHIMTKLAMGLYFPWNLPVLFALFILPEVPEDAAL